mgnify:CR=1 FL=1
MSQNCLRIGEELPKNGLRMAPNWARIGNNWAQMSSASVFMFVYLYYYSAIFGNPVMEHGGGFRHTGKVDLEVLSTNPVSKAALRGQETPKRGKTDG